MRRIAAHSLRATLVGALLAAALSACQWDETRFFDLRVVNDTHRTVKIQPCWDTYCLDMSKLPVTALPPGASHHEASWWPNDSGDQVSVAVRSPGRRGFLCLTTTYGPGQPSGVVRVSRRAPCPLTPTGGRAGTP